MSHVSVCGSLTSQPSIIMNTELLARAIQRIEQLAPRDQQVVGIPSHCPGESCYKPPRMFYTHFGNENVCVCLSCLRIVHICPGVTCALATEIHPGFVACPLTGIGVTREYYESSFEEERQDVYNEDEERPHAFRRHVPHNTIANEHAEGSAAQRSPSPVPPVAHVETDQYWLAATVIVDPLLAHVRAPPDVIRELTSTIVRESVRHWIQIKSDIIDASRTTDIRYPYTSKSYTFAHHVLAVLTTMRRGGLSIGGKPVLLLSKHNTLIPIPTEVARLAPSMGTGTEEAKRLGEMWRIHIAMHKQANRLYVNRW